MRPTGIDVIGDVPWGTHFCQFYESKQDLIDVLVPYFKAGLEKNEFCMWVASDPLRAEEAKAVLGRAVGNLEEYVRKGQIEFLDYTQWYTAGGGFDSDRVLRGWVDKHDGALKRGFDGLRLTGNTFWLEKSGWKDFTEYEARVDSVLGQYRMLALCTYSLDMCGPAEISDVVSNHQFAVLKRGGRWEIIQSAERRKAESALRKSEERLRKANADLERRVEERTAQLQAQIVQNETSREELRGASLYARSLLEASLDPLVTISPEGKITDVNQATESATGVPRDRLIGSDFSSYFTEPARADEGYRKVLGEGFVRDYPLTIRHVSGRTTDVLYNATVYQDEAGRLRGVFAAARDITDRNAAQRRQGALNWLLELFARKSTRKEYLESVVEVIRSWSGCQCAGIRVVDAEGNIPYESSVGFDPDFCRAESGLSMKRDACICARAAQGTPEESDRPLLTPGGSFRSEDSLAFVKTLAPPQASLYRGYCMRRGFASLAAVPVRYRDQVMGLIHLADPRMGLATAETVAFIETMTPLIGEAIHRFNAEAELARYRDHLEDLVRQRTDELRRTAEDLARSNQDLEQFAYVASHDLQEPLRAVAGFVGLLRSRYRGQLDVKADEYIEMAVDGAARMQSLINDLLSYSRVGTQGRAAEEVEARAALDGALKNLRASIEESGAAVTADPLPTLRADPAQLTQLFQNLIGNAIKFRGNQDPVIRVGADRQDGQWRLWVQDNGIGIDPKYQERIFLIFQRLHTRRKYAGTGIGLAVCKRIVERHGGRIWVESRPGEGATFHFTIPDRGETA